MPKRKSSTNPAYLLPSNHPDRIAARAKYEAEVKANLYAFLRLLAFSAIVGVWLALRK
jgi:hypothetical protein